MTTPPGSFLNAPANVDDVVSSVVDYVDDKVAETVGIAHFLGLRRASSQSVASNLPSEGYHKVNWPTVAFTGGTILAWDNVNNVVTNTSASTITVKVDCRIAWAANTDNDRWLAIIKTVSGTPSIEQAESIHGSPSIVSQSISTLAQMPAGSTLHIGAAQNTGSSLSIVGSVASGGGASNALSVEVVAVG